MQRIQSPFARNYHGDRLVRDEVVPGSEWMIAGEGVATREFDGTCCLIRDGRLYKRYEVQRGGKPPANFEPANEVGPNAGKQQGWVPVGDGTEDRWHREAFEDLRRQSSGDRPLDGTYELCGPKVQGNPEKVTTHCLMPDGGETLEGCPRDYEGLKKYLANQDIEGVVWHHPDGRMVKIKARGFGLRRATE